MIVRMVNAAMRAVLVAVVVALPAILVPQASGDATQIFALFAFLAAGFTFAEYAGTAPSIVEFRDAPPFNRLRFACLLVTLVLVSAILRNAIDPVMLTRLVAGIGGIVGHALDFAYSPVRLVVLMMPETTSPQVIDMIRSAAGLAYTCSAVVLAIFVVLVRFFDWPLHNGAFNVWVNLPLFDPTGGGDILPRLKRDAHFNVALGFLLPFLIPALIQVLSGIVDLRSLTEPQTLVWVMTAWAFLPTSMIMRGIALGRVSGMIEEKRRRASAESEGLQAA